MAKINEKIKKVNSKKSGSKSKLTSIKAKTKVNSKKKVNIKKNINKKSAIPSKEVKTKKVVKSATRKKSIKKNNIIKKSVNNKKSNSKNTNSYNTSHSTSKKYTKNNSLITIIGLLGLFLIISIFTYYLKNNIFINRGLSYNKAIFATYEKGVEKRYDEEHVYDIGQLIIFALTDVKGFKKDDEGLVHINIDYNVVKDDKLIFNKNNAFGEDFKIKLKNDVAESPNAMFYTDIEKQQMLGYTLTPGKYTISLTLHDYLANKEIHKSANFILKEGENKTININSKKVEIKTQVTVENAAN